MEQIKLVIWDMDETFWKGTLSDGKVEPIKEYIDLVKEFTNRGIVNSICSKNDFEQVKNVLKNQEFENIWDYFVFPSIDWTPKGNRINTLIKDMNLRPVNCLFLDDNINNLKEAQFVNNDLQVCIINDFKNLLTQEELAFKGKDDSKHSRLNQYKILEKKVSERSQSSSNEEFLIQSEIQVEMIEKDLSFERIHEMIHRNNQLNFTKDRISLDEVKRIFNSEDIRAGEVHVTDKYGDHGIVGCYAMKDNKLLQFVFSCRILGMGVEQYVYQQLNYPEITIVGEVAGKLTPGEKIDYINCSTNKIITEQAKSSDPFLIYGYCPLRPIWSYIQNKFEDITFPQIAPFPPACNIGLMFHSTQEQLSKYLENSKNLTLDTFYKPLLEKKFKNLLISFTNELDMFKYTFKSNPELYFYSARNDDNQELVPSQITVEDVYKEISCLAQALKETTRIFILTVAEVEFKTKGKDKNYYDRINLNQITEKLAAENSNIILLDIRDYAKYDSDFFEDIANHYNRSIGYAISQKLLSYFDNNSECEEQKKEIIPKDAIVKQIKNNNIDFSYTKFIINGELNLHINIENNNDSLTFEYTLFADRFLISKDVSTNNKIKINLTRPANYWFWVKIFNKEKELAFFETNRISYSKFNYVKYIEPKAANYDYYINSIDQFYRDNHAKHSRNNLRIQQILNLSLKHVSIGDFFLEKGITSISLYFDDEEIGKALLSNILISDIKITNVFTSSDIKQILIPNQYKLISVENINSHLPIGKNDHLIISIDFFMSKFNDVLRKSNAHRYYLDYILSVLMTKTYFPKNNDGLIMAVQIPTYNFTTNAYNYAEMLLKEERQHFKFSNFDSRNKIMANDFSSFNDYIKTADRGKLIETLQHPNFIRKNEIQTLKNIVGKYFNIENGCRKTVSTPTEYIGNIYLLGNVYCFGAGCSDEETIASFLQAELGLPYKVHNYSNFLYGEYDEMLLLLKSLKLGKNDVAIILLSNKMLPWEHQQSHWLNFDGLPDFVKKVDALPLFYKKDRPIYFQLPNAYSPECNKEIAKLIKKEIYSSITLFDTDVLDK